LFEGEIEQPLQDGRPCARPFPAVGSITYPAEVARWLQTVIELCKDAVITPDGVQLGQDQLAVEDFVDIMSFGSASKAI